MQVLYPSEKLLPYLEAYYYAEPVTLDHEPVRFPAVSTGYIKFSASAAIVTGQTTRPIETDRRLNGLGVKLRAGAIYALFGIPAREITNQTVLLQAAWGCAADQLIEQMARPIVLSWSKVVLSGCSIVLLARPIVLSRSNIV